MKPKAIFVFIFVFIFVASAQSQQLLYSGRDAQDPRKAWIQIDGQYYQVVAGTVISGWGTVTEITDSHLVTEYTLTEAEIEDLRSRGLAVYYVIRVEIPHNSLRVVPVAPR